MLSKPDAGLKKITGENFITEFRPISAILQFVKLQWHHKFGGKFEEAFCHWYGSLETTGGRNCKRAQESKDCVL